MTQRRLIEDLYWAHLSPVPPPFARRKSRKRGRRAQGIRYEKRVHEHFTSQFGEMYCPSLWFRYHAGDGPMQWCQPDALLIDIPQGRITIVEVKYQHTVDAWYQLYRYLTVVREVFGTEFTYHLCEVVKWYDCAVEYPEVVQLLPDLRDTQDGQFHVHIYRP